VCKLFAVIDIENESKALEFSHLAIKPLTRIDDDGLGVITLGNEGLEVERWLVPSDYPNTTVVTPKLAKYQKLLPIRYNKAGVQNQEVYAIGMHSRKATTPKCLENVHPFIREDVALIHNGVISNHDHFKKEVSTCDSEALLSQYLEADVKTNLSNIQKVADEMIGWYAFMVFNPLNQSLDIVKDDTTSLFFANVQSVGMVFCTSAEIIKQCAGRMKLSQPEIYEFPAQTAMRWIKGNLDIEIYQIKDKPVHSMTGWPDTDKPEVTVLTPSNAEREVIDVSKDTVYPKWCAHGLASGAWCGDCYRDKIEDEKDVPHWMLKERG
jgi:hypothetical protein